MKIKCLVDWGAVGPNPCRWPLWKLGLAGAARTSSLWEVAWCAASATPGARLLPRIGRPKLFGAQRRPAPRLRSRTPSSGPAKANALVDMELGTNQASASTSLGGECPPLHTRPVEQPEPDAAQNPPKEA